jgi:hypothetical protein
VVPDESIAGMGIWSDHFHPKIWLKWEVLGWIIATLLAVGGIVLIFDQYLIANICFIALAASFFIKIITVAISSKGSMLSSLIFAFLLCGLVAVGITATVRGVNKFRDKKTADSQKNELPRPNSPSTPASPATPNPIEQEHLKKQEKPKEAITPGVKPTISVRSYLQPNSPVNQSSDSSACDGHKVSEWTLTFHFPGSGDDPRKDARPDSIFISDSNFNVRGDIQRTTKFKAEIGKMGEQGYLTNDEQERLYKALDDIRTLKQKHAQITTDNRFGVVSSYRWRTESLTYSYSNKTIYWKYVLAGKQQDVGQGAIDPFPITDLSQESQDAILKLHGRIEHDAVNACNDEEYDRFTQQ